LKTNNLACACLAGGVFWCATIAALASERDYRIFSLEAEHALEGQPYRLKGKVSLPHGDVVAQGDALRLRVRYEFGAMDLYNPFFNEEIPASAAAAVFDHNKRFVGDLLLRRSNKVRAPDLKDWIISAQGGFIEIDRKLPTTCIGRDGKEFQLAEGKYFLQVVFHTRLGSFPPLEDDTITLSKDGLELWHKRYVDFGNCRSNVIEFEITEK
jgi:hypothetical protein